MHTTVAWSESIDPAGAYARMLAVPDDHIATSGDSIFVGPFNLLLGGIACIGATNPGVARMLSPSLRRTNPFYIVPIEADIHPDPSHHGNVSPNRAIPLDVMEALEVENNSTPGAVAQLSILGFLGDSPVVPAAGRIFTVNFEITAALILNTWSISEIDLIDELPIGNYDIVGAVAIVDNGVGFRFVPIGQSHRPGAPCYPAKEHGDNELFRNGNMGTWMSFQSSNLPSVQVLGAAAVGSATYQCFMDIIPR